MIKQLSFAVAAIPLMASASLAGPYIRGEAEAGFTGGDYSGATLEALAGYETEINEKLDWWTEAGVSHFIPDEGAEETGFVVKTGLNYEASKNLDLYSEVGAKIKESSENDYYTKVGFKYKF